MKSLPITEKNIIFTLGLFLVLFIGNRGIFESSTEFKEKIEVVELDTSTLNSSEILNIYTKEITITHPRSMVYSDLSAPIIILVHGDLMTPDVFNLITCEYLRLGFIFVSQQFDLSNSTFFEINATINFLQSHPRYMNHPIGIFGHSHGASFALNIGRYRAKALEFVICADFGHYYYLENEYLPNTVYDTNISGITEINEAFITDNIPPNFLFIGNEKEQNFRNFRSSIKKNHLTDFFGVSQLNQIEGNFTNHTARYVFIRKSLAGHIHTIISSEVLQVQLDWILRSIGSNHTYSQTKTFIFHYLRFAYMILCTAFAISASKGFFENVLSQEKVKKIILKRFSTFGIFTKQEFQLLKIPFKFDLLNEHLNESKFQFYSKYKNDLDSFEIIAMHSFLERWLEWIFIVIAFFVMISFRNLHIQEIFTSSSSFAFGSTFLKGFIAFIILSKTIRAIASHFTRKKMNNWPNNFERIVFFRNFMIYWILFIEISLFLYFWSFFVVFQWIGNNSIVSWMSISFILLIFIYLELTQRKVTYQPTYPSILFTLLISTIFWVSVCLFRYEFHYWFVYKDSLVVAIILLFSLIKGFLLSREYNPVFLAFIDFFLYFGTIIIISTV